MGTTERSAGMVDRPSDRPAGRGDLLVSNQPGNARAFVSCQPRERARPSHDAPGDAATVSRYRGAPRRVSFGAAGERPGESGGRRSVAGSLRGRGSRRQDIYAGIAQMAPARLRRRHGGMGGTDARTRRDAGPDRGGLIQKSSGVVSNRLAMDGAAPHGSLAANRAAAVDGRHQHCDLGGDAGGSSAPGTAESSRQSQRPPRRRAARDRDDGRVDRAQSAGGHTRGEPGHRDECRLPAGSRLPCSTAGWCGFTISRSNRMHGASGPMRCWGGRACSRATSATRASAASC